jgi:hypothetical protein
MLLWVKKYIYIPRLTARHDCDLSPWRGAYWVCNRNSYSPEVEALVKLEVPRNMIG